MLTCTTIGAKSSRGVWYDNKYPYQFYNVRCYGNERSFAECQYDTTGYCSSSYAVAVFCQKSKCTCACKSMFK